MDARTLINRLKLEPLPNEGGFYRETYRSGATLGSGKSLATAIYYLLTPESFSHLHRLPSDEIYHFYVGDRVDLVLLGPKGESRVVHLGHNIDADEQPQVLVPAGWWQGSKLAPGGRVALMGTSMSPGFDFSDYEPADAAHLSAQYPRMREWIRALCSTETPE